MTATTLHQRKLASLEIDENGVSWALFNKLFRDIEESKGKKGSRKRKANSFDKRNSNMTKKNTLNFLMYKVFMDGKYVAFDTPFDAPEFDWGRLFYIVTDKDYLDYKIEEGKLNRMIENMKIDEPVQIFYCPPTKEDIESIYTMAPDVMIGGAFCSTVISEGRYKGRKCTFNIQPSNRETKMFTQEELEEKICSGKKEKAFQKKVIETPDMEINYKGMNIPYRK